jgi:hypothetical protein
MTTTKKKSRQRGTGSLDLEVTAQKLSDCADALNASMKKALADGHIGRDEAFQCLAKEQMLRAQANQMHFDAALNVIAGLATTQADLDLALDEAAKKILAFRKFSDALTLIADVLALGAAIAARKPAIIHASLASVREDIDALGGKS